MHSSPAGPGMNGAPSQQDDRGHNQRRRQNLSIRLDHSIEERGVDEENTLLLSHHDERDQQSPREQNQQQQPALDVESNDDETSVPLNEPVDEHNNNDENESDNAVITLARRLRCLFGVITWPIVPLGTLVVLALAYFLYAAMLLRNDGTPIWSSSSASPSSSPPCAHPLHAYAMVSLMWGLYVPHHRQVRMRVVGTGGAESSAPRRYDQMVHTLALLYVYFGITLLQTCEQDTGTAVVVMMKQEGDGVVTQQQNNNPSSINACQATCPVLTDAAQLYVMALELFTLSLVLPLLFLPCIYLWFLRQNTENQEALAALQQRLRDEVADEDLSVSDEDDSNDFMIFGGGSPFVTAGAMARRRAITGSRVTADQILRQLCKVKLVLEPSGNVRVDVVVSSGATRNNLDAAVPDATAVVTWEAKEGARECCICMSEFYIYDVEDNDIETGNHAQGDEPQEYVAVVRTPVCGHLFHEQCIANWVGGRWEDQSPRNSSNSRSHRSIHISNYHPTPALSGGTDTPSSLQHRDENAVTGTTSNDRNDRRGRHRQRQRLARRTTCPLCRADLWRSSGSNDHAPSYGTF